MNESEFVTWLQDHISVTPFGELGRDSSIFEIIKNVRNVKTKSTYQYQPPNKEEEEKVEPKKEILPLYSLTKPLSKDDPAIFVQLPPRDVIDKLFMRILVMPQDLGCLEQNTLVTSDNSVWFEIPKPQSWVVTIDYTKLPKHKYLGIPFQGPFIFDLGYTRKYVVLD